VTKILIVDDAAFMRMRCSKLLSENQYEVVEAENGLQAIEKYKEHRPDAVLMDITMPELDGLGALKEIRRLDPEAKIAMVTAMGQQATVIEALKLGAKDFVLKPFQSDRVLAAVKKLAG
jgi:two-component system chemotaxis response regulator CheY